MRVIVTRPQPEADQWVRALREAGNDALALPLIRVLPAADCGAVRRAWEHLAGYDAVMFVSGNAVEQFFALKPTLDPVFNAQAAIKTRAFVTGPGSFSALLRVHAQAQCIDMPERDAAQFDSEALWSVVCSRVHPGYRVLIVRGSVGSDVPGDAGQGRDWFAKQVRAAGGTVDFVVAYQRCAPELGLDDRALVAAAAADGSLWLFSSSEAIANLAAAVPGLAWQHARALVTHARIGQAASQAGFGTVLVSRPTLADLMASIESMQ